MELCTSLSQPVSTLPAIRFFTPILPLPPCLHSPPLSRSTARGLRSRVLYLNNTFPKATSEETSSTGSTRYFRNDLGGVATLEEVSAVEKNVYKEKLPPEGPKEESAVNEESQMFEFLEKLNIKFPKLMEVVGLGYSFWFSSRYLLFKKNREELAAKIEELKQQVLGSDDE
ncbi:hypothetical protein CRYUN_Cryun17cG0099500 [Craigia yunnanensis]